MGPVDLTTSPKIRQQFNKVIDSITYNIEDLLKYKGSTDSTTAVI